MDIDFTSLTGLSLMLVLGLRHGFDPDHVAIIDAMVYRRMGARPHGAGWTGTLFALGHGLTVTAIAVALGAFAGHLDLPDAIEGLLAHLPVALLILVGSLNLYSLLGAQPYRPWGWKSRLIPARLRDSSHPLAIVGVGIVFALVFDTATQAAAWGYAASTHGGASMALLAGLSFTAGMVVTDSLDAHLMARLLRRTGGREDASRYRRKVGWVIVVLSFGMAAYAIATHAAPDLEAGDTALTAAGLTLFAVLLCACLMQARQCSLKE